MLDPPQAPKSSAQQDHPPDPRIIGPLERPPTEHGRRAGYALVTQVTERIIPSLDAGYDGNLVRNKPPVLLRLSLRPHPDHAPYIDQSVRDLIAFMEQELGGDGAWMCRDLGPDGAPHFYGLCFVQDTPGVATKIMTRWSELTGAIIPDKLPLVVRRVGNWNDIVDDRHDRRALFHFLGHLKITIGYACEKPWPTSTSYQGRTARDPSLDVIATGWWAEPWERAVARADQEMIHAHKGHLRVIAPLFLRSDDKSEPVT